MGHGGYYCGVAVSRRVQIRSTHAAAEGFACFHSVFVSASSPVVSYIVICYITPLTPTLVLYITALLLEAYWIICPLMMSLSV